MMEAGQDVFYHHYAGAEWLRGNVRYYKQMDGKEVSELGARAADLLGYVWRGIYHIKDSLPKVDWSAKRDIKITIYGGLSTFDNSLLTRLVIGAHDACLRVEIEAATHHYLRLWISERNGREGRFYEYHPTIEQAIERERADLGREKQV